MEEAGERPAFSWAPAKSPQVSEVTLQTQINIVVQA